MAGLAAGGGRVGPYTWGERITGDARSPKPPLSRFAAVSHAALAKSSVVKDQSPEGLGRAARSNIIVSQCGNMSPQ